MPLLLPLISLLSLILGIDEAEIVFAGDAMMHQAQIDAAHRGGTNYDFSDCFDAVDGYISSADYAVVNLETPVSTPPFSGYPCFNSPASYIDALAGAGFDLFLTANNHTLDRRDLGLRSTIDALDARSLDHIGTYKNDSARTRAIPFIKNINGIRVGFLNYTYGTNGFTPGPEVKVDYIDRAKIKADVEATRRAGAEFIFACIHWGVEYQLLHHSSQTLLAEYLSRLGVDAIIGSHPHVVQPMELTTTGDTPRLLVYSLGNFISNMKTRDTRGGALVKVKIKRGDDGKVRIDNSSYRLVFTVPGSSDRNFRLCWPDSSSDPRATAFKNAARKLFGEKNKNVAEDVPKAIHSVPSVSK